MQDFIYSYSKDSDEIFNGPSLSQAIQTIVDSLEMDLHELLAHLIRSIDDQLFLIADNTKSMDEQNQFLALMHLLHINKQLLIENGVQRIVDEFIGQYQNDAGDGTSGFFQHLHFNWSSDSKQQYALEKMAEALWHQLHNDNHAALKSINATLNHLFRNQLHEVDFPLSALCLSHIIADLFISLGYDASDAKQIMHALSHSGAAFRYFYSQQKKRLALFNNDLPSITAQSNGANVTVKIKTYRRDSSIDQINQDMLTSNQAAYQAYLGNGADGLSADMEACLTELQSVFNLPGSKFKGQQLYDVIADRLKRTFTPAETDAVNLVDNLFTRIMAEKSLPYAVRGQIENLKVPCLKLALDQNLLLADKTHPIIELIDMIADSTSLMATRLGEPDDDDAIFLAVRDAVQRLCFGYSDDEQLIKEINAALGYKISQYVFRNKEKYEKRRDKKLALINALKCKLHKQNVPPPVAKFVREIWYKVLNSSIDGDSNDLNNLQHLLDDLIWSVQPKQMDQEKKLLLSLIPKLVVKIRQALANTFISEDKCEFFIAQLEQMHINSLQGRQVWNAQSDASEFEGRQETLNGESIETNSWVRFVQNQKPFYLRLDYYNDFSKEYSFVDSAYQKIVVLNDKELANCLSLGEIELHAEHSLFSRSLRAVT